MKTQAGFYVDANGKVCSTESVPNGCHLEFHDKTTFVAVWIVVSNTGEVHEEYVLWPSLESLEAVGVDVSGFHTED